ncbi:MAG: tRNA (adenosine(37)-N6)-dimethylallyltransferase MiaA [Pirellulaceae bacterium]|nr:tRNA (adenosine(37)-N6)-dimethylallyltransferase MiaA [Pirellulaceae bacterium]
MRRDEVQDSVPHNGSDCFPPLVDDAIVLTGPTASGKSAVAMELAERIDGEILSLDSIAVYRGMDIGTAKPSRSDRQRVVHHMIDVVDPSDDYSVARYLRTAHEIVADLRRRNRRAIFVGGTPMFLKAILRGFDPGPPADWQFRQAVEADVEKYGSEALHQRLRQVDPVAAHNIGVNDVRRMIRALEVARYTGQPISHRQTQFGHARKPDDCLVFKMQVPRDQLHQRINQRVEAMFDQGLVNEVQSLIDKFQTLSRTATQAVGYREVIEWIKNGGDLELTKSEVAAHTRQLARRQETWLRSFSEAQALPAADPMDAKELADRISRRVLANIGRLPNIKT